MNINRRIKLLLGMALTACLFLNGCSRTDAKQANEAYNGVEIEPTSSKEGSDTSEIPATQEIPTSDENANEDEPVDFMSWKEGNKENSDIEIENKKEHNEDNVAENVEISPISVSSNEAVTETDDIYELITNSAIKKYQGYEVGVRSDRDGEGDIEVKFNPDDSRAVYSDGLGILIYWTNNDGTPAYEWWNGES